MRNRLRLTSGLILFAFVLGHFINHALGIVSLDVMDAAREVFIDPWRTAPGTIILIGAFIVHTAIALWALWDRRELKRPAWEWAQLVLGLSAPLFLTAHVLATRGLTETTYFESSYFTVMIALWIGSPLRGFLQAIALVIVWAHSIIGLHTWLRIKPGYERFQPTVSPSPSPCPSWRWPATWRPAWKFLPGRKRPVGRPPYSRNPVSNKGWPIGSTAARHEPRCSSWSSF